LKVWGRAMDPVAASYKLTDLLPRSEGYALVAKIRRAAVSIPANIAEGTEESIWVTTCITCRSPTDLLWRWKRTC